MKARLHIRTVLRGNKTVLQQSYFTAPFRLADITQGQQEKEKTVMVMSSSPGVLDGDEYHWLVELAAGTSLRLETQSYQRIFQMKESARQKVEVHMEPGSSFFFLPHPSVPHQQSCFKTQNNFHLAAGCTLIWGEVLTSGRIGNGESFQFRKYHSISSVYQNNKLVVRDNLLLEPAAQPPLQMGLLEGYTHQASLIYLGPNGGAAALPEAIIGLLSEQKDLQFGISRLPVEGLVLRILGHKAEQLHACLKQIGLLLVNRKLNPVVYAG